jgi:hypothetical protein
MESKVRSTVSDTNAGKSKTLNRRGPVRPTVSYRKVLARVLMLAVLVIAGIPHDHALAEQLYQPVPVYAITQIDSGKYSSNDIYLQIYGRATQTGTPVVYFLRTFCPATGHCAARDVFHECAQQATALLQSNSSLAVPASSATYSLLYIYPNNATITSNVISNSDNNVSCSFYRRFP